MAITVIATGSAATASAAFNDILVCFSEYEATTASAGWTKFTTGSAAWDGGLAGFWRRSSGSEPAIPYGSTCVLLLRGVTSSATPINVQGAEPRATGTIVTTITQSNPSITTTLSGAFVIYAVAGANNGDGVGAIANVNTTLLGGGTARTIGPTDVNTDADTYCSTVSCWYGTQASPGGVGAQSATVTFGASHGWTAGSVLVAFTPGPVVVPGRPGGVMCIT